MSMIEDVKDVTKEEKKIVEDEKWSINDFSNMTQEVISSTIKDKGWDPLRAGKLAAKIRPAQTQGQLIKS